MKLAGLALAVLAKKKDAWESCRMYLSLVYCLNKLRDESIAILRWTNSVAVAALPLFFSGSGDREAAALRLATMTPLGRSIKAVRPRWEELFTTRGPHEQAHLGQSRFNAGMWIKGVRRLKFRPLSRDLFPPFDHPVRSRWSNDFLRLFQLTCPSWWSWKHFIILMHSVLLCCG